MIWGLISHPYHRGGVTSWMMDFFKEGVSTGESIYFLVPTPTKTFISASGKLPISQILGNSSGLISQPVDFRFELGTFQKRVSFYKSLINKNLPKGSILIPSDDEAVWRACAELSNKYKVIGVLHSDDEHYYHLAKKYENAVAGFVSVSNRIKSKIPGNKPHSVIPCGIKIPQIESFPKKKNRLVYVGRIEEKQKRVSDLSKIFGQLLSNFPTWKLSIVGNGEDMERLKNDFSGIPLKDSVEFLNWLPNNQVFELLLESRILIQTSNFEGMSVAVMEALAAGCQILSSKVSGVEDLVADNRAKSIIELYPIGEIKEALEAFEILNSNTNEFVAQVANQLAVDYFSIESCWKAYNEFVENLSSQSIPFTSDTKSFWVSDLIAIGRLFKYKITH
jgi:glycosyltransferase involved in cell wall biosynthesis